MVPPIPKKKSGKRFEPEFLAKRGALLQLFLTNAFRHPVLAVSELMRCFVSASNADWEADKKRIKKMPTPTVPNGCHTPQGVAKVDTPASLQASCAKVHNAREDLQKRYNLYDWVS